MTLHWIIWFAMLQTNLINDLEEVRTVICAAVQGIKDTRLNQWTFSKEVIGKLDRILSEINVENAYFRALDRLPPQQPDRLWM